MTLPHLRLGVLLLGLLAETPLPAQPASEPHEFYWVANGAINAMAETNGLLYIGGAFTEVAPVTGRFVPIEPATGKIAGGFPKIFGTVEAAIPDSSGGWFVGGDFGAVENVSRVNLVHLLTDRSVDPTWVVTPNGRVGSLALVGDRLFVGGEFTEINSQPRVRLAELDPHTGRLRPLNVGLDGRVRSLASDGSKLFLGGAFANVAGQARTNLAAIDLSRNVLADWSADCNATVGITLLTVSAGRLFVGGDFSMIGSSNRNWVAALEPATGRVLPWNPDPSGAIALGGVAVQGNRVFLAGGFLRLGGIERPSLAAVDLETGALLDWTPALQPSPVFGPGQFYAMTMIDDTLYLGGDFSFGPPYMRAVSVATGEVKDWNPNPSQIVTLLAQGNGVLYTGGPFDTFGGIRRPYLAALDIATGRPTDWSPKFAGASSGVHDLALAGDSLFAGGEIESIAGEVRRGLCAVRLADASLLPFDANLIGFPAIVSRLAVSGTNLFIHGSFRLPGESTSPGFAVLDTQAGGAIDWRPAPAGTVRSFTVGRDRLYLAGTFSELGGQPRAGVGAYHISSHTLMDWQPVTDAPIEKFVLGGGRLLLGGGFTKVNGLARRFVASVDPISGILHPWSLTPAQPFDAMVTIGTVFYSVQPAATPFEMAGLAVDYAGSPAESWNPVFFFRRPANLLVAKKTLFAGGSFAKVNGRPRPTLAAFPILNTPPEVTLTAPPEAIEVRLPTELELRAEATDFDGSIDRVEFFADGQLVGATDQPPYRLNWNPRVIGLHVVSAMAIDNSGARSLSWSSYVTAMAPAGDRPPTVEIALPQPGQVFPEGTNVWVAANAADLDSNLARVEFLIGTNIVAVVTAPPFTSAISNLRIGTNTLTARAIDEYGVSTVSAPVNFRINARPVVTRLGNLTGPFYVGAELPVSFNASDRDGAIRSMRIVSGAVTLASNTAATISVTLSNLAAGDYELSGVAVDDVGGIGVSAPWRFSVVPRPLNDAFAQRSALPLMLGQVLATNTHASAEPFEPVFAGAVAPWHSLWWTWTPGFTGKAFVSTRGSSFRTLLAVYTGSSLTSLTRLGFNFSPTGLHTNRVSLNVTAGSSYQISVDGPGETGVIVLNFGPEVILLGKAGDHGWSLDYQGPTNISYVLQTWTSLAGPWTSLHTNLPGTEQTFRREFVPGAFGLDRLILTPEVP